MRGRRDGFIVLRVRERWGMKGLRSWGCGLRRGVEGRGDGGLGGGLGGLWGGSVGMGKARELGRRRGFARLELKGKFECVVWISS